MRIAVVLPWFTFLFTLFAAIMLFLTSSRLDRLEQAHEETYARTGVQIKKVSTVDRGTKEGTGPPQFPMPVHEKSVGPGDSTVGSPESRRSRSVDVDHSPPPPT